MTSRLGTGKLLTYFTVYAVIRKWLCYRKAEENGGWVAVRMLGWACILFFLIGKYELDQILPHVYSSRLSVKVYCALGVFS